MFEPSNPPPGSPPATLSRIHSAVADGEASWRTAGGLNPKAIAAECRLSRGQVYRKLDATEAFIRWLIVTFPIPTARMLSALLADSIAATELRQSSSKTTGAG